MFNHYLEAPISIYRSAKDNKGHDKPFTVQDVVQRIKSDKYRERTAHLRTIQNANDNSQYKISKFIGVTWSGIFAPTRATANLQKHSGLICLDIDKLSPDRLNQILAWLITDVHTFICFVSPNGNGLKVVVKIDIAEKPEQHKPFFFELEAYFKDCYEIEIDKSGKNVDRLCFLPYDANLFVNPDSEIFCLTNLATEERPPAATQNQTTDNEIFNWCLEVQSKKQTFVNGNRNYFITCLANFCNDYGVSKETVISECINYFTQKDFSENEIRNTIISVYQKTSSHGCKAYQKPATKTEQPKSGFSNQQSTPGKSLFKVHTAKSWLEQAHLRPIPKMLFGECWFEGELCILFADTNLGKSILAVQIGDSISKGIPIKGFQLEAERQTIIYFDFELSDKQFETRYSHNYQDHYVFADGFLRAEIDSESELLEGHTSFESYLNLSLENELIRTGAKILIIDNLTYLRNETERAKDALPLMKQLKALKAKYGLSILALAHTPKRDLTKPLTRNDLQGSKMLINFCDSAFTIGESSQDKSIRYLKQIKVRNTEFSYDADNICLFQIIKPFNFLQFEFLNYGIEFEHLKAPSQKEINEFEKKVKEMLENEPGITGYRIAKNLCQSEKDFESVKVKVSRILKKYSNT